MFDKQIYIQRRDLLRSKLDTGLVLFMGNVDFPANTYRFHQDSSFLYYFGLNEPGLAGILDVDSGNDILFGYDQRTEDLIWMAPLPTTAEKAESVGVPESKPSATLYEILKHAKKQERKIHFLPSYRGTTRIKISRLLDISYEDVKKQASPDMVKAIIAQRSVKIPEEIAEIEKALDITYKMHTTAMRMTRDGMYEYEICGAMEGIIGSANTNPAFPSIFTINGQVLHNPFHDNVLKDGRLVVNDSSAKSRLGYASDITRTFPVSGKFTQRQKEIYNIVHNAQVSAIKAMKPDLMFKDIHLKASLMMAKGLRDLDLMKGDPEEAVKDGAHALFFPHGLGHMLGLDGHDMEDLGEDNVGYDEEITRSNQFGLASLRMARKMAPGFVITVEPGIYFIPPLIDKWRSEKKFEQYINYDKVRIYEDFGGIRLEDDVLVTEDGSRILGKKIPIAVDDVEKIVGKD